MYSILTFCHQYSVPAYWSCMVTSIYMSSIVLLQKKDTDTWKLPSDRTAALSSSVMATKLSGVSDAWKVPPTKHNNGLALDSSAFRPPSDVGAPPTTTIISSLQYSSHSTAPGIEDSPSSSERSLIKKPQKRPRSPSGIDVMSEAQSKYLATSTGNQRTPSLAAVDSFSRDASLYNISGQQFSPVDNHRRVEEFSSRACSLMPLCHEYQPSSDGSKGLQLLPRQDAHTIPASSAISSSQSSQSSIVSPVAASPYLPFFNSTPSNNISGLYYPSPYVMLPAPPLPYQQTPPHFPCGWIPSVVSGTEPSPSKIVAEHMHLLDSHTQQQLHRAPAPSSASFDFPWMRGNTVQPSQFLSKASPQMCDFYEGHLAAATKQSFNQYMFMRNVSSLGAALSSDGLDMCRQPSCDPASIGGNRVLADNRPTSYLGLYPPLFHTPYLGIPSR